MFSGNGNTRSAAILAAFIALLICGPLWSGAQQEQGESAAMGSELITLSFYRYSNKAHNMYGIPLLETYQAQNPNIKIERRIRGVGHQGAPWIGCWNAPGRS